MNFNDGEGKKKKQLLFMYPFRLLPGEGERERDLWKRKIRDLIANLLATTISLQYDREFKKSLSYCSTCRASDGHVQNGRDALHLLHLYPSLVLEIITPNEKRKQTEKWVVGSDAELVALLQHQAQTNNNKRLKRVVIVAPRALRTMQCTSP